MEFTEHDRAIIMRMAKKQDELARQQNYLSRRLDHFEQHHHTEPADILECNTVFRNSVPPAQRKAHSQQFQAELIALFREYGVREFEGKYHGE
jgi:hypothetical protein